MWTNQRCFKPSEWKYTVRPPQRVILGAGTRSITVEFPPIDVSKVPAELGPITFECGCALLVHDPVKPSQYTLQEVKNKSINVRGGEDYGPFRDGYIIVRRFETACGNLGDHFLRVWACLKKDGEPIYGTAVCRDSDVFNVAVEIPIVPDSH